jgi:hypothetical protein
MKKYEISKDPKVEESRREEKKTQEHEDKHKHEARKAPKSRDFFHYFGKKARSPPGPMTFQGVISSLNSQLVESRRPPSLQSL